MTRGDRIAPSGSNDQSTEVVPYLQVLPTGTPTPTSAFTPASTGGASRRLAKRQLFLPAKHGRALATAPCVEFQATDEVNSPWLEQKPAAAERAIRLVVTVHVTSTANVEPDRIFTIFRRLARYVACLCHTTRQVRRKKATESDSGPLGSPESSAVCPLHEST